MSYDPVYRNKYYEALKLDPIRLAAKKIADNASRKAVRDWLSAYKLERGCADCGYKEFACALQLDHEGVKSIEIGNARSSIGRLKKEIEDGQCVVRCANCHSIRTWRNKQKNTEATPSNETA